MVDLFIILKSKIKSRLKSKKMRDLEKEYRKLQCEFYNIESKNSELNKVYDNMMERICYILNGHIKNKRKIESFQIYKIKDNWFCEISWYQSYNEFYEYYCKEEKMDMGDYKNGEFCNAIYLLNDEYLLQKVAELDSYVYLESKKIYLARIDTRMLHNQGYGSRCLQNLINYAKSSGISKIEGNLWITEDVDKLKRFYIKNGFEIDGTKFFINL